MTRWKEQSKFSSTRRNTEPSAPLSFPTFPFCRSLRPCAPTQGRCRASPTRCPAQTAALVLGFVFNNRYSGSVESTSCPGLPRRQGMVRGRHGGAAADCRICSTIPKLGSAKGSQARDIRLQRHFQLLVLQGARDWMTGDVPQYGDLDDHHIVPDAWGKEQSRVGS